MFDYIADDAILNSVTFDADEAFLNININNTPPAELPDWFFGGSAFVN